MTAHAFPLLAPSALDPTAIDTPFWRGLEEGELRIQRCLDCRRWTWAPQWRCGQCGGWAFEWPAVPMIGTVHALSRTRHVFVPALKDQTPFTNVLVDLTEAEGVRLLGVLRGGEGEIGAQVRGMIQYPQSGQERPALRWALAHGRA